MGDWILMFEKPAPLLSMNQQRNRGYDENHRAWRDRAFWAYVEAHPGMGFSRRRKPPSIVHVALPVPDLRRRDPANFQATAKPIVDGIQRAGAWPDDDPQWVDQRNPTFYLDDENKDLVLVRLEPM